MAKAERRRADASTRRLEAVVSQLTKLNPAATTLELTARAGRFRILTWMGVVGGAVTLFANLKEFITLADWARLADTHWIDWLYWFWATIFGSLGIAIPNFVSPFVSFFTFTAMLIIGSRLSCSKGKILIISGLHFSVYLAIYAGFILISLGLVVAAIYANLSMGFGQQLFAHLRSIVFFYQTASWAIAVGFLIFYSDERTQLAISSVLYLCLFSILTTAPLLNTEYTGLMPIVPIMINWTRATLLAWIYGPPLGLILISCFAILPKLNQRLGFMVIILTLLIAMNFLSSLDLLQYLTAPHQG